MAQPVANNTLLRPAVTNGKVIAAPEVHVQENPCNHATPQGAGAVEDDREPSYLLQGLLSCIGALEGADTVLLGACMGALQHDIGIEITDIGYMTVSQAVATNLAAPFWGILADRGILQRRTILLLGAMGQGLVTILLAFVTDMTPMILLRALNGVLLAALRPISNGIIADVTAGKHRGKIFSMVQSALLLGMFVTTMTVVPMAPESVLGFQGWRVAFVLVGVISVIVSGLVTVFMVEPPRDEAAVQAAQGEKKGCQAVVAEVKSLLQFFRMPTFCVMIMQGIFGTIPWSVMGYMTLFFQLSGIENGHVAILSGIGPITGAVGNVIGGLVADGLAARFKLHGRPLSAQLTVAMGVPLIYLMFLGVTPGQGGFGAYLALNLAFGLLGTWAQSGTNFPILSHIVPASARSRVMAWECAFENSIANAVGPIVVGNLAGVFGYKFGQQEDKSMNLASAEALGKAMAATICIPWIICFLAYSLLHWSYPRDVRRQELQEQRDAQEHADKMKQKSAQAHAVEADLAPIEVMSADKVDINV
mmetsp:Transcript_94513/g.246614  ORF Transcript_94513/g.246614 Transcript_94513/m.246614 type:complete len:534 (-) Transcript_94513:431-2032(-)